MSLFSFGKKQQYFTEAEQQLMVEAIREAERNTSGEIRLFVEGRCRYVDPLDRAGEIFFGLKMENTRDRNAVLLYIAVKDHQLAIFADEGIYQRLGKEYWHNEVKKMLQSFSRDQHAQGICTVIGDIGTALKTEFPYDKVTDKNELPDNIVFGR